MGSDFSNPATFGSEIAGVAYQHRPAAYAVIRDHLGRVAAVKTRLGHFLPGGGMDAGETPEATVEREVREELARGCRILGKLGEAIQYFSVDNRYYRTPAVFFAAEFAGERQGEAEYELCWLEPREFSTAFFHECHAWAAAQP
jgi:8-oxo-dGTP diphosphatase